MQALHFESLIETQLDLPEGTVEVTDIIILSRDDLEIIVEYTITLTEEELAETEYEDLEDIVEELFGAIQDEHDIDEIIEEKIGPNKVKFSAKIKINYLNEY